MQPKPNRSLFLLEELCREKRRRHHPTAENYTNNILSTNIFIFIQKEKKPFFMKILYGLYFKLAYKYFHLWKILLFKHCSQVGIIIYHPDINRYKKTNHGAQAPSVYILLMPFHKFVLDIPVLKKAKTSTYFILFFKFFVLSWFLKDCLPSSNIRVRISFLQLIHNLLIQL